MLQLKWENLQILRWNLPYMTHEYPDELPELDDGRALRNIDPNAHCQKAAAHNSSTNVVHFTSFI